MKILNTGKFSLAQAEENPEWLKEARVGEHTPESVEYGITSFTFKSPKPFHPRRLYDAMISNREQGDLAALVRAKGFCWLATRGHAQVREMTARVLHNACFSLHFTRALACMHFTRALVCMRFTRA